MPGARLSTACPGALLGVSLEELIGDQPRPARRGPAPRLQQQLERLRQLPKAKQKLVVEMLETVLRQAG